MEDGGSSLFDFVQQAHHLIKTGKIDIRHWHKVVRCIFKQMVEAIEYMHSLNICHFDISLENWLINDVAIRIVEGNEHNPKKLQFDMDDIQIKLCDFGMYCTFISLFIACNMLYAFTGLAQLFTKSECLSNKWCGKKQYKSPEVVSEKKKFDAKKNDIWCVGMCLLLLETCQYPWAFASKSDEDYLYFSNNSICDVFDGWIAAQSVDEKLMPLFDGIFQLEDERMSILEIRELVDEWK